MLVLVEPEEIISPEVAGQSESLRARPHPFAGNPLVTNTKYSRAFLSLYCVFAVTIRAMMTGLDASVRVGYAFLVHEPSPTCEETSEVSRYDDYWLSSSQQRLQYDHAGNS